MKRETAGLFDGGFTRTPVGPFTYDYPGVDDGDASWRDAHADFLSSMSDVERADLLRRARLLELDTRDRLFQAGDESDDVFIVADGCIRVSQVSLKGKETIIWLNFRGEIFGMAELLNGNHRQVYAEANQPSRVYSIRRQEFTEFLGACPEAAMKAISILSARVRSLGCVLARHASDTVETRIACLLSRFATILENERCCSAGGPNEWCINVRLRHQDIASLIGASRQTVTTTLRHLSGIGAIRMVDRHIHIVEPGYFRSLVDENAD
ncbi:MAG: Crp/Fnr family transcriptional regulator [Gammaproteobacteria bacterium]|nr:Crp/Fnr family transcriptional regulator [Gammaproteobacteria bacterium]